MIEVTAGEVRSTLGGAGVDVRGEAAAVDLPGGQTLFALLRYEDHGGWAGDAMFDVVPYPSDKSIPIDDRFGAHVQAVIADRTLHVVPRTTKNVSDKDVSAYPMLVRFGDIRDPKSVALVNPDDLAASFGAGYRLRRMTVQRTDDPVTVGIEKRLPRPPFDRKFVYHGEKSKVLDLYEGKIVSERIDIEDFVRGTLK